MKTSNTQRMGRKLFHENAGKAILCSIFLAVFFSIRFTNLLIILYIVNWLAGSTSKTWRWQSATWPLLLIISPWLLELVSVLYSTQTQVGLHQVEKRLALLAIPFITLHSVGNMVNDRVTVFRMAAIATVLTTLYCLAIAIYNSVAHAVKLAYWEDFTQPIILDPGYASLMINIVSMGIVHELAFGWNSLLTSRRIFYLSLLGYFGIVTFFLASKLHGVIFVAIVIIGLVLIYRRYVVGWKASLLIVGLLLAIGFSVANSKIKERFANIGTFTIPPFNAPDDAFNELTLRLAIFQCATDVIAENPIFGTGVGDVMVDLESVYRKVDFKFGYNNSYDPHNQYVRVCLATGIVGLALFVTSLVTMLAIALRTQAWLAFGFVILFCTSFLFESVLERHSGILMYAFFQAVLFFGNDGAARMKNNVGTKQPQANE